MKPIIHNIAAYEDYPFEAIEPNTLLLLQKAGDRLEFVHEKKLLQRILLCLECYLQVTDQKLTLSRSNLDSFDSISKLFIGSLNSDRLTNGSQKWKYGMTRVWLVLIRQLKCDFPNINITEPNIYTKRFGTHVQSWIDNFETTPLNHEKVWIWRGWHSVNRNGQTSLMPLYPVYRRLGKEFTQRLFEICDQYYRARKLVSIPSLRSLTRFIGQYSDDLAPSDFLCPEFMGAFWRKFFVYFVSTSYADGAGPQITTIITLWRDQVNHFIKECLIGSELFAEPWGELPSPEPKYVRGARTNIQTTSEGYEVKTKLLTYIPLHVSDEEALHLLFEKIEFDFKSVVTWAEWCCTDIWQRYQRQIKLSTQGTPRLIQNIGANTGEHSWLTDRNNPEYLKNAAATFAHHGFLTGNDISNFLLYPVPLTTIAEELALPTTDALLPHCMLLVAEHPAITPSFLEKLEIFDKNGKLTGFVKTDGGYKLVGHKYRRGPKLAQQIIDLTPKASDIVHQIIALTQPLRDYLKLQGDEQWRYLLLTCKQGFAYPSRYRSLSTSTSDPKRLINLVESFGNTSSMTIAERRDLVGRLSLQSLRASAAVLVYLRTRSTENMSQVLGHSNYDPKLLDHYLPKPILDFFQERWVRIFQNGIIVEALKESKYLLEASDFKNMDELHQFLSLHALRLIPQHLIQPVNPKDSAETESQQVDCEVVFGVNSGILTALLSLQMIVEEAKVPLSAKANYWAGISRRLVSYIESEMSSRPDILDCLKTAQSNANPSIVRSLIHAD